VDILYLDQILLILYKNLVGLLDEVQTQSYTSPIGVTRFYYFAY